VPLRRGSPPKRSMNSIHPIKHNVPIVVTLITTRNTPKMGHANTNDSLGHNSEVEDYTFTWDFIRAAYNDDIS
jgi:hypothetical protein